MHEILVLELYPLPKGASREEILRLGQRSHKARENDLEA